MLSLSKPQEIFLNGLNTKYRAYVGGFGCVHPDTKIHTENGLMRISDITQPIRVLSWCENSQKFQLSLSGGSFPKGKANLYRVLTEQGEFAASGHHQMLCADGKYRQVQDLQEGDEVSFADQSLPCSSLESDPLSCALDAQRCSETTEGLMGDYANAARLYGQQLLEGQDPALAFDSLPADVQKFAHSYDSLGLAGMERMRNRHYQLFDRASMSDYLCRSSRLDSVLEDQKPSSSFARTSDYPKESPLSLPMSKPHCKELQYPAVYRSLSCSSIESTTILSITIDDVESPYYDMQVLGTNNYVSEDGCIHHNSGKTFVGCLDLLIFFSKHPGTVQGYFGPTYPAIRDIFFPTFAEAAELMGFTVDTKESNKEVHVYRDGKFYGTVICRSMDNPTSIVGFKISRALVDEIDVLKAKKADDAWNKIVARMRLVIPGVENSIGVTTTPEGFKFVYNKFANNPSPSYSMVQASTYENADYLPPDYIDTLMETYPEQLITAYLNGDFVNLTSGTVYRSYNRIAHRSRETVQDKEPVFIGMDFNIDKMAATVYVLRDKAFHAVDQIKDGYNTPEVADIIKRRYKDKGHKVIIYPDSSGKNRTRMGGASESDIAILKAAPYNYSCRFKPTNPPVKDRINATNAAFENGLLFVNDELCPDVAACYEQQVYAENGEPDKSAGNDHQNDASTYPIAYELPIKRPATSIKMGFV